MAQVWIMYSINIKGKGGRQNVSYHMVQRTTHLIFIVFYQPTLTVHSHQGLAINYGEGGLHNGKIAGPKYFAAPSRQGKTF